MDSNSELKSTASGVPAPSSYFDSPAHNTGNAGSLSVSTTASHGGSCAAITVTTCGSSSMQFASVEGSSLEEKLSFLVEQRERENIRCEAFAREVEEAIEREMSARCGGSHHSAALPALPHPTSPYHSHSSCRASLPTQSNDCRPSPSNGNMPARSHVRHVSSAGNLPELQRLGGQQQMGVERAAMRRIQSAADMTVAPACQWFVDLSYYERASPVSAHRHTSGRRTRMGTAVHSRSSRRTVTGEMTEQLPRNQRFFSI